MNKADLVDKIAGACEISKAQATTAIDTAVSSITGALRKGDRVALIGFGTFSISQRKARNGRNPQTGATIKIAARKVAKFSPGAELKKAVNKKNGRGRPCRFPCPLECGRNQSCGYNVFNMIAHLRGTLLSKHPNQAVVETSGVGYEVNISVPTFSELPANGSEVALHIHTHVREDLIALYGFLRPAEKQLFEKLMTVSGIGAKLAITILSGMAADEMAGAIRGNDVTRLTRIPGIGKKTAERMGLEQIG